jgi:hypothetical protein
MARFSQMMLRGMLDPSRREEYSQVGQNIGQIPGIMALNRDAEKRKEELANIYSTAMSPTSTAEQMSAAAQQLLAQGKVEEAMQLAQQARARMQEQTAATNLQTLQETIVDSANKLGMEDLAERALNTTDEETLRAIQKDLRSFERQEVIRLRGIPGRKALAKNVGLEWNDETMANMSDEAFTKLLEGSEAELKSFVTADGREEMMLEVDSRGRVMDPDSGRFVRASELGLRRAPNRQQVETVANYTSEKLAEAGVKRYDDLATAANDATRMMNNITEVMPNIDEMITGKMANAELFVRSARSAIAAAVGLDPEDPKLSNTQTFLALAAPRVAGIIKDFGAGTGLSDADREFATLASAGDITMTATALRNILKILKDDADTTLGLFEDVTADIRADEGKDPLIFYRIPALKSRPTLEETTPAPSVEVEGLPPLPAGATLDGV